MLMSRYRYPQPPNEDAFEEFCLALVREAWARPGLERYGHRGDGQHGVDLLDLSGQIPLLAIQCKHHRMDKTLPPKELEDEVNKALKLPVPIGEYVVLTTAKKSAQTQLKVLELNVAHLEKKLFRIQLFTWDDIERLIDGSPAARQLLGLEIDDGVARVLQRELHPLHEKLRDHVSDSQHGELDEVKMHLEQGKPQDASVLLQRLRRRAWVDLTPGQQFRWCRLQADAHLRLGEDKEAAKLLIEARRYAPDDERGITNEILAWRILGDLEKARTIAEDAQKRFPHSAAAYAACIEVAASKEEAESLARSVPTELQDATDILVAIAARLDLGELAEHAARRGVEVAPEDIKTWFALGTFALDVEQKKVNLLLPGPKQPPSKERLHEARDAFSKVIELATRTGNIAVHVAALLRRAFVWSLLGNAQEVRQDTEKARQLAPDDRDALFASGCSAEDRGDHEAAAEILREVVAKYGDDDEVRFFLAISLWNKKAPEDRAEATRLFATVAKGTCPQKEPALTFCIEGLIGLGLPTEASNLLGEVEATTDPALVETLRARLAKISNDDAEASRHADSALAAVTERTPRSTLKKVATVLMSLQRLTDALPLLQRAAAPGVDTEVGYRLVDCAGRLEQHGIVLDYCRRAREAGHFDEYLLAWELRLLDRYEPTTALTILVDILSQEPKNHRARVRLVELALRLGQTELAKEHLPLLPGVTEVDAPEGATIVRILVEVGRARDALPFAYDLLRRHFSDYHAHRAFLEAVLWRAPEDRYPDEPEVVVPGVAVCLTEDGATHDIWNVLEDSRVESFRIDHEVKADSSLAKLLIGKRVGDDVALSDMPGLRRTAVIKRIIPKYVYRFQDVLIHWQYRFPDRIEFLMGRAGNGGDQAALQPLFELLDHMRACQEEAENLYRTCRLPIGAFAQLLGRNEIRAVQHIIGTEGLPLWCCAGTAEEHHGAFAAFRAASEVVMELSGLATLLMLDELQRLDTLGKKLLISQTAMRRMRALAKEARAYMRSEGSLAATPNGPRFVPTSEEQKKASTSFIERTLRFIEERFTIANAPELADMEPGAREQMAKVIGEAALESAVIASQGNRVLWADDGVLAYVVSDRFNIRRIWTQAGLKGMADEGCISHDVYTRASAKLIGWGYTFTGANPAVFHAAGTLADWRRGSWPLRQAIEYLGLPAVGPAPAIELGAFLVKDAYLDAVLPEVRRGILIDVVETLSRRKDITERAFDQFGQVLSRVFGLNVVGHDDAEQTFLAWRTAGRQGLVRP